MRLANAPRILSVEEKPYINLALPGFESDNRCDRHVCKFECSMRERIAVCRRELCKIRFLVYKATEALTSSSCGMLEDSYLT